MDRYPALERSASYGFVSGSVIAGVSIIGPVAGTTLASTAGLINPVGSGVIVKIKSVMIANTTISVALKSMVIGVQSVFTSASGSTQPSSITKQTVVSTPFGTTYTGQAYTYSAATLNFGSGHEFFDANFYPFGTFQTAVGWSQGFAEFSDELILNPGTNAALYNMVTAIAGVQNTWTWEEYPLQAI